METNEKITVMHPVMLSFFCRFVADSLDRRELNPRYLKMLSDELLKQVELADYLHDCCRKADAFHEWEIRVKSYGK